VRVANEKTKVSSLENLVGELQDTRKNPHVIDVGLRQNIPVSCWYYMLTAISTTANYEI
jgi:hypothetical protein